MNNFLDRRRQFVAMCLAALSGYVDGVGFLALNGLFVSFMSGNSTRLAVGIAGLAPVVGMASLLIASFVLGVALGTLTSRWFARQRKAAVLLLVTLFLALAALFSPLGIPHVAPLCMAIAMGAVNCVFQRNGEVTVGLTYMTGTLVRVGQRLALALTGGPRWDWLPWLQLWLSLVAGGVLGALAYMSIGLAGLWYAAGVALIFAVAAWSFER